MKSSKIKVFYTKKQVNTKIDKSFSKSPLKPKLVIENIKSNDLINKFFEFNSEFKPFRKSDFKIAHTRNYVDKFFEGKHRLATSNSIPWSRDLAESVKYTNASLYSAIRHSVLNPKDICFSPTSGFHHAQPQRGSGFCTFSGQVIASMKIYNEFGFSGAYLDLDGHFGNSIEDSRRYVTGLDNAIPRGFNFNPDESNEDYVQSLGKFLQVLKVAITNNKIHYIVWCHGADSHEHDDIGRGCDTKRWIKCSTTFFNWLKNLEAELGREIPLTLSLFGGYRKDDYQSVINLHLMDLGECINVLIDKKVKLRLKVKDKQKIVRWQIK